VEYFHDPVRIGRMIFEGLPQMVDGSLQPDLERAGNGLVLREADARKFAL
jgi:L-rhamnonate dehydratase